MFHQFNSGSPHLPHSRAFPTALYASNRDETSRAAREKTSGSSSYATADEEPSLLNSARDRMHESDTDMDMTPAYVPMDEHERVLRENENLFKNLERTNEEVKKAETDAEVATVAFRMLAGWAYNERKQLLEATDKPSYVGDARREMAGRSDRMLREQIMRSDVAWARFTRDLLARREQAEEEFRALTGGCTCPEKDPEFDQPLSHGFFKSRDVSIIASLVDQLIEDEKGRLPRF